MAEDRKKLLREARQRRDDAIVRRDELALRDRSIIIRMQWASARVDEILGNIALMQRRVRNSECSYLEYMAASQMVKAYEGSCGRLEAYMEHLAMQHCQLLRINNGLEITLGICDATIVDIKRKEIREAEQLAHAEVASGRTWASRQHWA